MQQPRRRRRETYARLVRLHTRQMLTTNPALRGQRSFHPSKQRPLAGDPGPCRTGGRKELPSINHGWEFFVASMSNCSQMDWAIDDC
jgi:hypothetical protein